ncbi:hypothetical protein KKI24_08675 [bacterium]|nr:hypothetical protein [bacterium]
METEMTEALDRKLERFQQSAISEVFELFVRIFTVTLSSAVMLPYDIKISSVKVMTFKDYLQTVQVPASINSFKIDPLDGHGLMVLDSKLVWSLLHAFYGGYGEPDTCFYRRTFSPMEMRLANRLTVSGLEDLQFGWKMIAPVKISYLSAESEPEKVDIIHGDSIVVICTIDVMVGSTPDRMAVCIPYVHFESYFSQPRAVDRHKTPVVKDINDYLNSGYFLSPVQPFLQKTITSFPKELATDETTEKTKPEADPQSDPQMKAYLADIDAESLANCLIHEHPQTIALILANITDNSKKSILMNRLPVKLRPEVEERMNYLLSIPSGVLTEIEEVLKEQIEAAE